MTPRILIKFGPSAPNTPTFGRLVSYGQFWAGASHVLPEQPLVLELPNEGFLILLGYVYDQSFRLIKEVADARDFIERLSAGSPSLHDRYDGSYLALFFRSTTQQLSVASDRVGFRFLYFAQQHGTAYLCTHMTDLAKLLTLERDQIGVLEYSTLRYCLGTRTLFKRCERIPPGFIGSVENGHLVGKAHLPYHLKPQSGLADDTVPKLYDFHVKVASAFQPLADQCSLALSSGWDSRLILSGIMDRGFCLDTFTSGTPDSYEVSLAKDLADAGRCPWSLIDITGQLMPEHEEFVRIVDDCEAGQHILWHAVHPHVQRFSYVFMGDLFEALQVRAPSLATKNSRMRYFVASKCGFKSIKALTSSDAWFDIQADTIVERLSQAQVQARGTLAPTRPEVDSSALREGVHNDISVLRQWASKSTFSTIASLEEFWHYALKVRFVHGDQLRQISSGGTTAVAITTTAWFAEMTTAIDVREKLNNKLRYKVNRSCPHRSLRSVPSYDTPWVSADWPNSIRNIVQGARSMTDDFMMKRHARDRRRRETLLKHYPLTRQLVADRDKILRFPHQETFEMKSWLEWVEMIDSGKRRAFTPTNYLNTATLLRLLNDVR